MAAPRCLHGYLGLFGEVDARLDRVEELGLGLLLLLWDVALAAFAGVASFARFVVAASEAAAGFIVAVATVPAIAAEASAASFAEGFALAAVSSLAAIAVTESTAAASSAAAEPKSKY